MGKSVIAKRIRSGSLALLLLLTQMFAIIALPQSVSADGSGSSADCLGTTSNVEGSIGGSDNTGSEDLVTYNAGSGKIVTGVCIKSGENMFGGLKHSGVLGNGTYENNCYTVSGVGTQTVTVTRIGSGSDCQGISHIDVVTETEPTTVEVIKKLNPTDDIGLFNLKIEGTTHKTDASHNGTTGAVEVNPDEDISIAETPGTGTVLTDYTTSVVCKNQDNETIDSGAPTGVESRELVIEADKIELGDVIVCTITNTRIVEEPETGSIKVKKKVDLGDGYVWDNPSQYGFKWGLNDEAVDNEMGSTQDDVEIDVTHTVKETEVDGWTLTGWYLYGDREYSCTNPRALPVEVQLTENHTSESPLKLILCNEKDEEKTGSVKVNKQVDDDGDNQYNSPNVGTDYFKWGLEGESTDNNMGSTQNDVALGSNKVDENTVDGYNFTGWYFNNTDYSCNEPQGTTLPVNIEVEAGETVELTLCNQKEEEPEEPTSSVKVTKFNDKNNNGLRDTGEETLSNWEMNVSGSDECNALPNLSFVARIQIVDCIEYDYYKSQLTGVDGSTTFTGLKPGVAHTVSETQQDGWEFSSISCVGVETAVTSTDKPSVDIYPVEGETVECVVGNHKPEQPAVLAEQTLVNTGDSRPLQNALVSIGLTTLALGLAIATRRQKLTV